MGISNSLEVPSIGNVKQLFSIGQEEIKLIRSYSAEAKKHIPSFMEDLYKWKEKIPEFNLIFARGSILEHLKKLKTEYWQQFFDCELTKSYIQTRISMIEAHTNVHLPLSAFIASISYGNDWWIEKIRAQKKLKDKDALISAISRLTFLDTTLASTAYTKSSAELLEKQNLALQELSTPTIQLWKDVLILPIVGLVDSSRAQLMTRELLLKIQETSAKNLIIDITGVATMDSGVANHLIKITRASRLMGCTCILSGIGPEVAQLLVQLGVGLEGIETSSTLETAFQMALEKEGSQILSKEEGTL